MREKTRVKKITTNVFILSIILVFISCVSYRGVYLINLTTKESSSETELILTTTVPVPYKDTKIENPPRLIISFPEDKVFSIEEDVLIINKGAIKKVKYEHSQREGKGQRQLNAVIVELTQDLPYKISNSGSSIIVRIENPEQSLVTPYKEKTRIASQPQMRGEARRIEPRYFIGPGDVLNIEVWKQPDISREVVVNYKGEIKLPPIREMSATALSVPQLEEKLRDALSKYIIDPIVFVTIKEYNSQRVTALGETTTGIYTLKRKTTLVEFLSQIGGTSENADISRVRLIKKDGRTFTYDLNELIDKPQKSDEVVVSDGDTVYVSPLEINKVYVLGEVRSPRVINIKGKLTLIEAITEAGGYTREAVTKSTIIIRGELGALKGYRIDLNRILKKGDIGQNIELKPGDIVYLPKSFITNIEQFIRLITTPLYWYVWFIR